MWGIFVKSHGKQRKPRHPRVLTPPRQNPQQIEMEFPPRDFPQQPGDPHAELGDAPPSPKEAAPSSPPWQQAQSKWRNSARLLLKGPVLPLWGGSLLYTRTAAQHV